MTAVFNVVILKWGTNGTLLQDFAKCFSMILMDGKI